jgi:hypothetical protein
MGDLGMRALGAQSGGKLHSRNRIAGQRVNRLLMGRRVLLALLSAVVLVGLFTKVASAAAPTTAIARGNSFAFDATTGRSTPRSRRSSMPRSRRWPWLPTGCTCSAAAGGTFKTANGVARSALAAVDPVTGVLSGDVNLAFTGTTLGAPSTVAAGVDWSTVRGAFLVSGRLYPATPTAPWPSATSHHRHVPLERPPLLHPQWRRPPLLPLVHPGERRPRRRQLRRQRRRRRPQLVHHQWHDHGSGRLVYATTTGTLATVDFSGGLPAGSATVLSGPIVDGRSWQSRGLFVL